MQTNQVYLGLSDGEWRDRMLYCLVRDLIFVTKRGPEDEQRLRLAGSEIQVFHPNTTLLGSAMVLEGQCPNAGLVMLRLASI